EQGYADAQFNLGVCYENGWGVPKDAAEAVKWYRAAAEQGYADAQFNLAQCYRNGRGVPKDEAEAVKWYRAAAEQGYADAQFNLAQCYMNGRGVPKDEAEAVKWHRAAAEQGDAEAQYLLGTLYIMGIGVDQDASEAEKWFRAAAEQGNADAQDELKEFEDVRVLLRRARQGDAESQYELAVKYEMSFAVNTDEKEALFWYRKAAAQGHRQAKFMLSSEAFNYMLKVAREGRGGYFFLVAYRYEYGIGTKKNMEKARYWYKKAAEEGHYRSKQKLQEMGRE
ncbi:MAG: sel1 repeat family protein, partial [Akkermansia sp.]|nr:sel1 repeat family protein [Akkermansia sp.]